MRGHKSRLSLNLSLDKVAWMGDGVGRLGDLNRIGKILLFSIVSCVTESKNESNLGIWKTLHIKPVTTPLDFIAKDSITLKTIPDSLYNGDSGAVSLNANYDTLSFTYSSYRNLDVTLINFGVKDFKLITNTNGDTIIERELFYGGGDIVFPTDKYADRSFTSHAIIPGGLKNGKYKVSFKVTYSGESSNSAPLYFNCELLVQR